MHDKQNSFIYLKWNNSIIKQWGNDIFLELRHCICSVWVYKHSQIARNNKGWEAGSLSTLQPARHVMQQTSDSLKAYGDNLKVSGNGWNCQCEKWRFYLICMVFGMRRVSLIIRRYSSRNQAKLIYQRMLSDKARNQAGRQKHGESGAAFGSSEWQ